MRGIHPQTSIKFSYDRSLLEFNGCRIRKLPFRYEVVLKKFNYK
jgi:hypothetical protein